MKKTTFIAAALLVIGTAAFAQEKKGDKPTNATPKKQETLINTSHSNIHNHQGVTTATVTPTKQEAATHTNKPMLEKDYPKK